MTRGSELLAAAEICFSMAQAGHSSQRDIRIGTACTVEKSCAVTTMKLTVRHGPGIE
jgi:hypothetical protein